ncbi:hypothetical protein A163_03950 [Vibrio tasmaniensis 1F-267]|uniref:Uncharacterized protein n=1 Tax=Vibrio tasmaniensis 1F-267 TaxID=1191324 RepID=A0ABX3B8N4_9VIBR|nr:hypothetical protein A163_03950 [Vibrio tasmaniensis 1F-267]
MSAGFLFGYEYFLIIVFVIQGRFELCRLGRLEPCGECDISFNEGLCMCTAYIKLGDTDLYLQYTVWVTIVQNRVEAWPIGKG